jgi:hypothetical protein
VVIRTHRAQLRACPKSAELLPQALHAPWTGKVDALSGTQPGSYIKPLDVAW